MNEKQHAAMAEWYRNRDGTVLSLIGPSASGKTYAVQKVFGHLDVLELSGFGAVVGKAPSVKRPGVVVVVEDADFCDDKSLGAIAATKSAPVACVSVKPLYRLRGAETTVVRFARPTVRVAADVLVAEEGVDLELATRTAEKCDCDLRQCKIALRHGGGSVDRATMKPIEAISRVLYPYKGLRDALELDGIDVSGLVPENYLNEEGLRADRMASVSDDISRSDVLRHAPEVSFLFSVASAPFGSSRLSAKPSHCR